MEIKVNIPDQDIEDVLITALEGGSNYWYYLPDVDMALMLFPNHKGKNDQPVLALSEKIIRSVLQHGAHFGVWDIEETEGMVPIEELRTMGIKPMGVLNKENIMRGLNLWLDWKNAGGEYVHMIFDPAMDAEDADLFFQLCVLGEVVYG